MFYLGVQWSFDNFSVYKLVFKSDFENAARILVVYDGNLIMKVVLVEVEYLWRYDMWPKVGNGEIKE